MPKPSLGSVTKRKQDAFVAHGGTGNRKTVQPATSKAVDTVERKKATFNMDGDLHHRLKLAAVTQKREMTEMFEQAVREYLDRNASKQPPW